MTTGGDRRRRIAAFVVGLALPLAALAAATPADLDDPYLDTRPADFAATPKHLIIGTGCWTWTTEAYMPVGEDEAVNTQKATLHAALNAQLAAAGPSDERFFAFGKPDVDFDRHLISLFHAVRQGTVKSVVYINAPGSLQAFTRPDNAVAVVPVLDAIAREHPALAADVATYRAALLASEGYRRGLEKAASAPVWAPAATWVAGLARRWDGMRNGLALTPFPARRAHDDVAALVDEVRANYDNPVACGIKSRGLMAPEQYWIGSGGDAVWQAWLRVAAGLAAAHRIPFVFYVPPHLNVPEERYAAEFRPAFVDRVRAVLEDVPGATVIDHATRPGLTACDLVYDTDRRFASGYLYNFVGKLKQARMLLAELSTRGLVATPAEAFARPSPWERSFPAIAAPPQRLSAEESEAVREELIRDGEWRLSRPASEVRQ
ncbi:MAG: hypothetical protein HY985_12860 [Magnetospirillum sp.]|nr:hypothetical protein [Magnetospirillum sp.]